MTLYVTIQDYGYDGTAFRGVFSSEEKARAAAFGLNSAVVLKVTVDRPVADWEKLIAHERSPETADYCTNGKPPTLNELRAMVGKGKDGDSSPLGT